VGKVILIRERKIRGEKMRFKSLEDTLLFKMRVLLLFARGGKMKSRE